MNEVEKLALVFKLRPGLVTYSYRKVVKDSKRDGYTITKESLGRLAYYGKKYRKEDGTESDPAEERKTYSRISRHLKQTISTGNVLVEMGTVRNPKRHTIVIYYLTDSKGTRAITKEDLKKYLTPKQYENETKEVEGRKFYVVNLDDITELNGVAL